MRLGFYSAKSFYSIGFLVLASLSVFQWNEIELRLASCRSSIQFLQAAEQSRGKTVDSTALSSRNVMLFQQQLAKNPEKTSREIALDCVRSLIQAFSEFNAAASFLGKNQLTVSFQEISAPKSIEPHFSISLPKSDAPTQKPSVSKFGGSVFQELMEEGSQSEKLLSMEPSDIPSFSFASPLPKQPNRSWSGYLKSLFIVDENAPAKKAVNAKKLESMAKEQLALEEIAQLQKKSIQVSFPPKKIVTASNAQVILGPGFKPIVPLAGRIQLRPKGENVSSSIGLDGKEAPLQESFSPPSPPTLSSAANHWLKRAFKPISFKPKKEEPFERLSLLDSLQRSYNRFKSTLLGLVWPGQNEGPSLAELYQPEVMSARTQFFVGKSHELSPTQTEKSIIELIPSYAYAQIVKELTGNDFYYIAEPELEQKDTRLIEFVKKELLDIISVEDLDRAQIFDRVDEIVKKKRLYLTPVQKQKVVYFLSRDLFGLGKIEALMHDPLIEDIECDGVKIPLFIVHRSFGHLPTNILFETQSELENFVIKLAQLSKSYVSYADPLLNSILPDGSRVNAVLTSSVSTRGPTFTIRRFPEVPLSPTNLILNGTIPAKIMAYLWTAIEFKRNILIIGPTAAGKTTVLNALAMFIPPGERVVSIEDTRELNIEHENWLPEVSRIGFGPPDASGKRFGSVSMMDLIKESFRQRPDYLLVGEVRGEEAYVMFQGMASGHAAMSTMHARSVDDVVSRLTTPPINLYPTLLETVDIIIHLGFFGTGSIKRFIRTLAEVQSYNLKTQKLEYNNLYSPQFGEEESSLSPDEKKELLGNLSIELSSPQAAGAEILPIAHRSLVLRKIIENQGVPLKQMQSRIEKRSAFLEKMAKEKVLDYHSFNAKLSEYLKNEK